MKHKPILGYPKMPRKKKMEAIVCVDVLRNGMMTYAGRVMVLMIRKIFAYVGLLKKVTSFGIGF